MEPNNSYADLYYKTIEDEEREPTGLCCCEYYDRDHKRFHILGCCCKCEDFDLIFTRLICCRGRIDPQNKRGMLLTFQDRLRIPWRGGAKQISLDTILPVFIIPLAIGLAAINIYTACIIFLSCGLFIAYAYFYIQRSLGRSRFLCMWMFCSAIYMVALFQFTVPLLELLPEENLILVLLATAAIICFWRTKQGAVQNFVLQSTVSEDELPDITEATAAEEEEAAAQTALLLEDDDLDGGSSSVPLIAGGSRHQPNICSICRKYVPARTFHCTVCAGCIRKRDHHSYWLDCCIGECNKRMYLFGLLLSELALLLGANLTLTAVCHPFLVVRFLSVPVMLPDDCSEVFDDYELGISFVIALYALVMAAYILIILLRQVYLISRGRTLHECQRAQCLHIWKTYIF